MTQFDRLLARAARGAADLMGVLASVDGRVAQAAEARVSVLDNGFAYGDGVYETLRTYGGRPFVLERHLARLRGSAARLGFAVHLSDAEFAALVDDVLSQAGNRESYIRIIVTRGVGDLSYNFDRVAGPTVVVVVKPYEPLPDRYYEEGIGVAIASIRRNSIKALDPAIKSCNLLNSILAVREAQAKGAQEAIMLNEIGQVAEGASSNVFLAKGGALLTPPLEAGILPGITRALLLELAHGLGIRIREDTVRVPDLLSADEVFISSTLKEVAPVTTVDGARVGAGRPGPLTLRLLAAYRERAGGRAPAADRT